MITSVTSATIAATSAAAGWGLALGAGGAVLVIGLLIAMELLGSRQRTGVAQKSYLALRIAVSPLLLVFAVSVAAKVLSVLAT